MVLREPVEVGRQQFNVSVVIPAFNAAQTIRRALQSVDAQTLRASEVIVVDNGSSDNTTTIVHAVCPRARVVVEPKQGAAFARNLGIEEASCDWVAFLDADDRWDADKLEKQVARLDRQQQEAEDGVGVGVEAEGDAQA